MRIILKNKETLLCDDFEFSCSIGKNGTTLKKIEGDKKTPKGIYSLGPLYYRKDRIHNPKTKLKKIEIKKFMGWCDDVNSRHYNKLIKKNENLRYENLYRKERNYDLLIPIKYNFKKPVSGKGSCIFIHLTKNYKPTAGCVALREKDFLIMLKLIKKNSKIKII